MSSIELKNINKSFDKKIIDNFNYTFYSNNVYMISGKTGSGKSTLLSIIAKEAPFQGEVIYKDFSNKINLFAYSFKNDLLDYLTGLDNLLFVTSDLDKIKELASYFKISDLLDRKVNEYSNGEYQRLSIIRLLLSDKPVLLLDEPTSALDDINKKRVYDYLYKIKDGKIIIIISHDYEDDRFVPIKFVDGKIEYSESIPNNLLIENETKIRKLDLKKIMLLMKPIIKSNIIKNFILSLLIMIISFITFITISPKDNRKEVYDQYSPNIIFESSIVDNDTIFYMKSLKHYTWQEDFDVYFKKDNCINLEGNTFNPSGNQSVKYKDIKIISYEKACELLKADRIGVFKKIFENLPFEIEEVYYSESLNKNEVILSGSYYDKIKKGEYLNNTKFLSDYYEQLVVKDIQEDEGRFITISKELYDLLISAPDKLILGLGYKTYKSYSTINYKDIYKYDYFNSDYFYSSFQTYEICKKINYLFIFLLFIITILVYFAFDIKFKKSKVILTSLDYKKVNYLPIYIIQECLLLFDYLVAIILYNSVFNPLSNYINKYYHFEINHNFNYVILISIIISLLIMSLYWIKNKSIFKIEKIH